MNKIEYLNALKEALKNTDEEIMEEIISDYEEHFQVGLENGKSEEEICDELGMIDDLVNEIKEVYHTDAKKESQKNNSTDSDEKKGRDWRINIPNIDSEKINTVINNALDSADEAISKIDVSEISHSLKNTLNQATSSINHFADNYLRNQGSGHFGFNKKNVEGYRDNVSKSYDIYDEPEDTGKSNVSYDTESMQNPEDPAAVHVQNTSGNYNMEKADDSSDKKTESAQDIPSSSESKETQGFPFSGETDKAQATSSEAAEEAQASSSDTADKSQASSSKEEDIGLNLVIDGICADITVQKSLNNKININYENNGNERQKEMYEFYSYKDGNTVYAGIRKVGKAVFLFNLRLNSININVELPENMQYVNIKTANGNIKIQEINADRIITDTASGDISVNQVYATDFKAKCSSGDITLGDINSVRLNAGTLSGDIIVNNIETKFLSLKSSSGDMKARNLSSEVIDNSSLSGNINIDNIKVSECKIRNTSGNIIINDFSMNNADVSSVSGDVKIAKIIGDGLRASSVSGKVSLEVNIKRCHASSKSGNVNVTCTGDIVLESNSTSGNVNVNLKNYGNGYCIKSRSTSGGLYINYSDIHQRNLKTGTYTFGNQGSELNISSISGNLHIND